MQMCRSQMLPTFSQSGIYILCKKQHTVENQTGTNKIHICDCGNRSRIFFPVVLLIKQVIVGFRTFLHPRVASIGASCQSTGAQTLVPTLVPTLVQRSRQGWKLVGGSVAQSQ